MSFFYPYIIDNQMCQEQFFALTFVSKQCRLSKLCIHYPSLAPPLIRLNKTAGNYQLCQNRIILLDPIEDSKLLPISDHLDLESDRNIRPKKCRVRDLL